MDKIILNGKDLQRQQVIDVAYDHARVSIDTGKINESLEYINKKVKEKKIIYGVTTGFGSNAGIMIGEKDAIDLQLNLLRSHACGFGKNFSKEISRAIMVIRLNTLLKGNSGVQKSTVEQLAFLLNNDIHPLIPEQGSVGASGDLCPLSHMALPLIGEGEVEYRGKEYLTAEFLETGEAKKIGFSKISLSYKEGVALSNGTTVMTAVGTIALYKAERLLKVAMLSSALIFESLGARKNSFAYAKIHEARNHAGQTEIALWLTKLLSDSNLVDISQKEILTHLINTNLIPIDILDELKKINRVEATDGQFQIPDSAIYKMKASGNDDLAAMLSFAQKKWKPQDAYSIRCLPQVFGASKTAIDHVVSIVDNELNAAVDNPLIFAEDEMIVSGGNFHGQPIALVMDYLKLAVAEIGNITERQINKMVDPATNDCLPGFLTRDRGLNSGLMIIQYAAASIVSENKVLVHPASSDSIPTSANTEDHVSMGTIAARQALEITENVEKIITYSVFTGFYAVSLRLEQFRNVKMEYLPEKRLAEATCEFYKFLRETNKEFDMDNRFLSKDRFYKPEIEVLHANFDAFAKIAEKYLSKTIPG
jgi:histidine ammonia-lyase